MTRSIVRVRSVLLATLCRQHTRYLTPKVAQSKHFFGIALS
ncbi:MULTISPECIES: hypothetical protein [unclassified Microcoleus]|nr:MULTISPECIES: hypothetical protein [unclassified Microcoleus]